MTSTYTRSGKPGSTIVPNVFCCHDSDLYGHNFNSSVARCSCERPCSFSRPKIQSYSASWSQCYINHKPSKSFLRETGVASIFFTDICDEATPMSFLLLSSSKGPNSLIVSVRSFSVFLSTINGFGAFSSVGSAVQVIFSLLAVETE